MRVDARAELMNWLDCYLDPAISLGELHETSQKWFRAWIDLLGIDERREGGSLSSFQRATRLAHGEAISPLSAARCVWEFQRTAQFLRGMDRALQAAFATFPGETIHVVEAGCGPLAPLALPFAVRYPPERVQFTLIDCHDVSLECARCLANELGVTAAIRDFLQVDAARHRFPEEDRPHIIACEVMQRALVKEPQVAVTLNLAPQLRPGGAFLPEWVEVHACLFDAALHYNASVTPTTGARPGVAELGLVFRLDARELPTVESGDPGAIRARTVSVPRHEAGRSPLRLFTRIGVQGDCQLLDFDSSLNLPERLKYPIALAERGGQLAFRYHLSDRPGWRFEPSVV